MTELIYAPTAKTFRASPRLLGSGDLEERVEALTTLLFDSTKWDVRRALLSGQMSLAGGEGPRRLAIGRSMAFLSPEQAEQLIEELEALVARFDAAHAPGEEARPFAFSWVFYPASRTIR
jgi:HEAT repeat protein